MICDRVRERSTLVERRCLCVGWDRGIDSSVQPNQVRNIQIASIEEHFPGHDSKTGKNSSML